MAPIEPGDSGWEARKERLLERVHGRGQALLRRRRLVQGLSAATAVLLLVAVPGVLAASGGGSGHKSVRTIGGPSTSTSEETTTTEAPTTEPPTTVAPPPTTAVRRTTTSLVCHNSYNPACGPFYWVPGPPADQPLTVQVTFTPSAPKAGDTVTFHVVADDPDGIGLSGSICDQSARFGEPDEVVPACHGDYICSDTPYGPWTAPPSRPAHQDSTVQHVYSSGGTYKATFFFRSHGSICPTAYGSEGWNSATVVVSGPPASTTTTAP